MLYSDSDQGFSQESKDPWYIAKAEITEADETSGTKAYDNATWTDDLSVQIHLNVEGQGYDDKMRFGGEAVKDAKGKIVKWGKGAWRMNRFFGDMGIQFLKSSPYGGIDPIGPPHIPQLALRALIGKKVLIVKYVNYYSEDKNQVYYGVFDRLVPYTDRTYAQCTRALTKLWEASRKNGFPKRYDPDLLKKVKTFTEAVEDQIEKAKETEAEEPSKEKHAFEDDLPF